MDEYGRYAWQDGRKYEWNYKNDKKHEMGTYSWEFGREYEAEISQVPEEAKVAEEMIERQELASSTLAHPIIHVQ